MGFVQSLAGTLAGFCLALLLFYITERTKQRRTRRRLLVNLRREFQYNLSLLESWEKVAQEVIFDIIGNARDGTYSLEYSCFQRLVVDQITEHGFLYDTFSNDEIMELDGIFRSFNEKAEADVSKYIARWQRRPLQDGTPHDVDARDTIELQKKAIRLARAGLTALLEHLAAQENVT